MVCLQSLGTKHRLKASPHLRWNLICTRLLTRRTLSWEIKFSSMITTRTLTRNCQGGLSGMLRRLITRNKLKTSSTSTPSISLLVLPWELTRLILKLNGTALSQTIKILWRSSLLRGSQRPSREISKKSVLFTRKNSSSSIPAKQTYLITTLSKRPVMANSLQVAKFLSTMTAPKLPATLFALKMHTIVSSLLHLKVMARRW